VLAALHLRDLALIEDVWLEFGPGFTALTGETGAGKTVLVEGLKLLMGERADSTMVRQGAAEALVEGTFVLDGREVVVRRRLSAEGRSRCSVDNEMATVGMLSDLLGSHIDLHGQHEHQALLSPSRHAGYLDRFIGSSATEALSRYHEALGAVRVARAALGELEEALADRGRRIDYLRFQIADIDAVGPREGEDTELEERLPRLRHAERLAAAAGTAWVALREEGGASDALTAAMAALAAAAGLDPKLDALADEIRRLDVEIAEAGIALRSYADAIEHDPAALDETERRLQQLADLKRKYGPTLASVLAARDAAARELEMMEAGEEGLERAREALAAAEAALREAGAGLVAVRDAAVGAFERRLAQAASDLALEHASFAVARKPLPFEAWNESGPECVEFLFAPGHGESPRPLAKIASGGEVSRVMLALKSVLGSADAVPVLVFDEVDAGIGGATALAVGRRLAALARDHQVLVVTHLPQVAAYADAQVLVEKTASAGRTVTTARTLDDEERVSEIARMLAGGSTEAGLVHARELLSLAASERAPDGQETPCD
jgi:DNA repair protein RecN (Recombination protein N)